MPDRPKVITSAELSTYHGVHHKVEVTAKPVPANSPSGTVRVATITMDRYKIGESHFTDPRKQDEVGEYIAILTLEGAPSEPLRGQVLESDWTWEVLDWVLRSANLPVLEE